jgi:hypothetical protein
MPLFESVSFPVHLLLFLVAGASFPVSFLEPEPDQRGPFKKKFPYDQTEPERPDVLDFFVCFRCVCNYLST